MPRLPFKALSSAALVFTIAAFSVAEDEKIQRELISWREIHAADFPVPPSRMRKPTGKRLGDITAKLDREREPIIKALLGREFYGLCEIVTVRPYRGRVRTLDIVMWERQSIDKPSKVGVQFGEGQAMRRLSRILIRLPIEDARSYAVGDVMNVTGVVERVQIEDWHDLMWGEPEGGTDIVVTVILKDVEL